MQEALLVNEAWPFCNFLRHIGLVVPEKLLENGFQIVAHGASSVIFHDDSGLSLLILDKAVRPDDVFASIDPFQITELRMYLARVV
jgi:hypothetical protein